MVDYMEQLSVTEAEKLRKTIACLLRQTCILQEKYDPAARVPVDNEQYDICVRHRPFLEAYFAVTGCELLHDSTEHIFRLTGEGIKPEPISRISTMLILLLKLVYRDKIMGEGLSATVTNRRELREYGRNTGLINRKLTEQEWSDALGLMKKHQMVEYPGAVRDMEDETPIYIYSTVNVYCSFAMLNELMEEYGEEETADEAGEENPDKDADE